jgi:hypothetical protein
VLIGGGIGSGLNCVEAFVGLLIGVPSSSWMWAVYSSTLLLVGSAKPIPERRAKVAMERKNFISNAKWLFLVKNS